MKVTVVSAWTAAPTTATGTNDDDKIKKLEGDLAAKEKEISKLKKALAANEDCLEAAQSKLVVASNADLQERVRVWLHSDQGNMRQCATSLYGEISEWDTSKVTSMKDTFNQAASFNQDISKWDTSKVTDMTNMFFRATAFDHDISNWNTSKVTSMGNMFGYATSFNQTISNWDTSKVTNMDYMFNYAIAFNQDISNWDTSKVTNMYGMFHDADAFNANQKITASCENNKCTLKKP